TRHLITLLMVYGLLTQWDLFWLFFYNLFTNEPNLLIKTMIDGKGNWNMNGSTTADALNAVFTQGMEATSSLFQQANWENRMMYLYAAAVFVVIYLSVGFAVGLLIYAKLGLAVLLFIAPIFICFLLFPSTRRLFENWLQGLLNLALVPVVTCAI